MEGVSYAFKIFAGKGHWLLASFIGNSLHRSLFNFIYITHKTSNITPLCKPFRKIGYIKLKGGVYKVKLF